MARRKKPKIVYLDAPETESQQETGDEFAPENVPEIVSEVAGEEENQVSNELVELSEGQMEDPVEDAVPEAKEESSPIVATQAPAAEPDEEIESPVVAPVAKSIREAAPPYAGKKPRRGPNIALTAAFGAILLIVLAAFIFIPVDKTKIVTPTQAQEPNCLNIHPDVDWGYEFHTLTCSQGVLEEGRTLADVLLSRRVSYKTIIQLTENAAKSGLPDIVPGNSYTFLQPKSQPMQPYLLAYAPDAARYVLMNLKGTPEVKLYERALLAENTRQLEVAIQTNLAEAMYNREFGLRLARAMETALKYKLDFFHLDPGDRFSLLFQEKTFEGDRKDIGKLDAVRYRHKGAQGYAFWYQDAYVKGYFDSEGRPMRSGFLKAPLEYGRISSPYNRRRPDPVSGSGKIMPHLGTDYAAPSGTPIIAVADGVVMKAEFKGGNGNYVKLLHSAEIQTQYLHMKAFAEGIRPGAEVQQGQVIGYVGSTGRSTGPHVCFRYWKNGEQVDHRKEKTLGPAPPLKGPTLEQFQLRRDSLMRIFEPV